MAKDGTSGPLVAMVALNAETLPDPALLLSALRDLDETCPNLDEITHEDHSIVFPLGEDMVAISLMPAPIPWTDLEGPCATAWWWPDATEQMSQHTHHLIVALLGGSESPLQRHIRLTQVVAVAAANSSATGIFYCPGTVVHDPAVFQEQAGQINPENIEPQLWIDMRLGQNDDGSLRFFTTGMETFGQLEIEIDQTRKEPDEILHFCYTIINYLLTSDVHLKDGETIGRSAAEKVKARHQPSMWKRGTVLKLAYI